MRYLFRILRKLWRKFWFDFMAQKHFNLFWRLEVIRIQIKFVFRMTRVNFVFWSQALMTTGAAIIATSFFTEKEFIGFLFGFILLVISAVMNRLTKVDKE